MTEVQEPKAQQQKTEEVVETTEVSNDKPQTEELKSAEKNATNNAKTAEDNENSTENTAQEEINDSDIVKQVEFYFSDANLTKDKFLSTAVQRNEEGYVPIETIAMFNRMKKFRPLEKIVDALRASEFLAVSDSGELVKRRNKFTEPSEEEKREALNRTVYVKGFPMETSPEVDWQKKLEQFFSKFGTVIEIRLRRDRTSKALKGDIFVEFSTKEQAEALIALDPKPQYEDSELFLMSKNSFVKMKSVEKQFSSKKGKGKFHKKRGGKRGSEKGVNKNRD